MTYDAGNENDNHGEGPSLDGAAAKQLAGYIQRIERLVEERKAISEDIKSIYAEAAAAGMDKKALKQIIKERDCDLDKTLTHRAVTETYRRALSGLQGELGDWARSYRSRAAKTTLDAVKQHYADPKLDEFLKGRKARGGRDSDTGKAAEL